MRSARQQKTCLWLAHIDGDALPSWAEMPGRKLGAEIIDDEILQRYPLPHTVSVVEAEMTSLRAVDDRHDRMHAIAKKIFARDNVEIATHTFSHPYAWGDLKPGDKSGVFNLDVRRYFYDVKREISGSADFIDRQLAPAGKRTRVLLWSGDALPGADALQEAKNRRLINMNGGGTVISEIQPVLSMVSPMARTVGDHVQAYAPIMNENVYTNDWTGPYYGFHRVIETMTLTEHPRRLKPINIYYHFYAGTKAATMRALREIYDWTLEQDIHPVYVSEYARKVPDFRDAGVARYLDGRWKVSGLGDIRSLRIVDSSRQWPVIENSVGVVGAKQLHDGMYLHTNGADQLTFYTSQRRPALPHLVSSNGRLLNWNSNSGQLRFRVHSHVPASVEIGGAGTRLCNIKSNGKVINGTRTGTNTLLFQFNSKDTGDAVLDCQT